MPRRVQKLGGDYNVPKPSKTAVASVALRPDNREAKAKSQLKTLSSAVGMGEGYRLLNEGEILENGDEFYSVFSASWCPLIFTGLCISHKNHLKYRRRISTPPDKAEVWVPIKGDVVVCVKNLYPLGEKPLKVGQIFKVAKLTIMCGHACVQLQEYPGNEMHFCAFSPQRFRRPTPCELELYESGQYSWKGTQ